MDASTTVTLSQISAYTIPTEAPESDGTADWDSTTIVTVELQSGGATGFGFVYGSESVAPVCRHLVEKVVLGSRASDIPAIHRSMDRLSRNWGRPGLVSSAIAAVDIALWDLKARSHEVSVADLLGRCRTEIPAYGSGGFTSYTDTKLIHQMTCWADQSLPAVKMKIGRDPRDDLKRVAAVGKELAGRAELYVDANGAYRRKQALYAAQHFDEWGVTWFEEPVSSDDRVGLHMLVERAPSSMDIAAGEYIYVLDDARLLVESQAVDVLQVDVTRCGGITNFLKIAALCETEHLPLSAHTAPSLHASLCCSVLPAINVEYFYDHQRIEAMLLDGAARPLKGKLKPDFSAPGLGLQLKRQDAEPYQVYSGTCQ